jgi:hypothetical protein
MLYLEFKKTKRLHISLVRSSVKAEHTSPLNYASLSDKSNVQCDFYLFDAVSSSYGWLVKGRNNNKRGSLLKSLCPRFKGNTTHTDNRNG